MRVLEYAAALFVTIGVCVSTPASEIEPIEETVITATPLGDPLQPNAVLDAAALILKSAPTLGETLANELGLSSSYFGPAASRPIIRGLGGSRVTVLTDSASSLDVSDVSPDHALAIEPLLAEEIEVIRGPTTLLYGSAATGGVINVRDNRIPQHPNTALRGGIEVRGDTAASARAVVGRLDGGHGALAWHLDGFTRATENIDIDGFATAAQSSRAPGEERGSLANSYSEAHGYAGGLSWVGTNGYLGVALNRLEQTYGLPGPEADVEEAESSTGPPPFEGPFLDMQQTRIDLRGEYQFGDGIWDAAKIVFGHSNYEHSEIEASGLVATVFDNDAWQLRFELVHRPIFGLRGAFGVEYNHRDFSALGDEAFLAPTTSNTFGAFIAEELNLDWAHVHFGARYETVSHDNESAGNYNESAFSAALGVSLDLPRDFELTTNLSRTARNPSIDELYSNGTHIATRQFERGLLSADRSSLNIEYASNIEIGLRRDIGVAHLELNLFFYDIEDYIYQDLNGSEMDGFALAQYAQNDAEFYGAEAALVVPLAFAEPVRAQVRFFSDYVSAELSNGTPLPRLPPWRLGTNVALNRGRWHIGADIIYHAGKQDISSYKTAAYTLFDMHVLYEIGGEYVNWELFSRATNLLDEDARKSTSFLAAFAPLPGRSLHLGVRARF